MPEIVGKTLIGAVAAGFIISACGPAPRIGLSLDQTRLNDGIYEGQYKAGPNSAEVRVTIEDQKVLDIEIIKHNAWRGRKADPIIPKRIIEEQSTAVDAVSGATNSSHVIMNAVHKAVEKAAVTQSP